MKSKVPGAGYFFQNVFVSGSLGLLIAIVVCGVILCHRNDIKNGSLRYKNAVFIGAAGQIFSLEDKVTLMDNQGINVGLYFRDAALAGIGFNESIFCLLRAQEIMSNYSSVTADLLLAALKERYSISLPQSIYSAVNFTDNYWKFFDNDEDRSLLAQVLRGEAKIPTTFDEYEIWPRWLTWLFVGILQSTVFIGYLLSCKHDCYSWYALPWRHVWPFLGMFLLFPGGYPFLILAGGFVLITKGWGRAKNKNIISTKIRAGRFDYEAFIKDSRARVEKLHMHMKVGGK